MGMATKSIKKLLQVDNEMKALLKKAQDERSQSLQNAKNEAEAEFGKIKENYDIELQKQSKSIEHEIMKIEQEIKREYEEKVKALEQDLQIDCSDIKNSKFGNKDVIKLIDEIAKVVANE